MRRILGLTASSLVVAAHVLAAPLWPLDMETRYLTGNFMEPRDGRFHTALDLKTNGETGYAVLAVRDGWISRIKFAPNGYGKAIYLAGDDGRTYVYAHLERLDDRLRAIARREQARRGQYAFDRHLGPDEAPVIAGEVLAISGQTATTGPHLHFEVRDAAGCPLDPLAHGFAVADTIAPTLRSLRLVLPPGTGSYELVASGGLGGELPAITVPRLVELRAGIVDHADHLRYRLWPASVRLSVDDRTVFEMVNSRLRWPNNRHQRMEFIDTGGGRELRLAIDPRNGLTGRDGPADWSEALAPGPHRLALELQDDAGNRTTATWTLNVAADEPSGGDRWRWTDVDYYPRPLVDEQGEPLVPLDHEALERAGLTRLGAAVAVQPRDLGRLGPFDVVVDGAMLSGAGAWDTGLGLYRFDREGRWSWVEALPAGPTPIDLAVDRRGLYLAMRDDLPPAIDTAAVAAEIRGQPPRRRHGIAQPCWPIVAIPLADAGSGVDWDSVTVQVGDTALVAEPDPPRDRLLLEFPDDWPAGEHRVVITASDRSGLTTHRSFAILLRGTP